MNGRMLVVFLALFAAVAGAQRPVGPSEPQVSFDPGEFKMLNLGEGGHVPAEGPIIRVAFDKTHGRYSHIDQRPLALRATVSAACGKMNFQEMRIATLGQTFPASTSGLSRGGGMFYGVKTFTTNQVTTAALASVVPDPVATCNSDLAALVKQGKHAQVQKGWARRYDSVLLAELTASCQGEPTKRGGFTQPGPIASPGDSARFPVWVHCSAAAIAKPPATPVARARPEPRTTKGTPGLQAAKVFVNPPAHANYRGPCPRVIAFGGEVEYAHAPGGKPFQLRYRYRSHDGGESPIMTTTLSTTGKRNITYWKREFGAADQKGVGGLAAKGGSAARRVVDGWVRLEILGASGAVVTYDQTSFRLTCEPRRVSFAAPPVPNGGIGADGR